MKKHQLQFKMEQSTKRCKKSNFISKRLLVDEFQQSYPRQPNIIRIVKRPRAYVNHSYRDFANVPVGEEGYSIPTNISEMTFPQKVYHMLADVDGVNRKVIRWCSHGRAFHFCEDLGDDKVESSVLLNRYFGRSKHNAFKRDLINHGFKQLTTGPDAGCYYHELMLRGLPHLCKYFPPPVDMRKKIPDPDNEPNFYEISELFPLPGDKLDILEEAKAGLKARGIVLLNDKLSTTDRKPKDSVLSPCSVPATIVSPTYETSIRQITTPSLNFLQDLQQLRNSSIQSQLMNPFHNLGASFLDASSPLLATQLEYLHQQNQNRALLRSALELQLNDQLLQPVSYTSNVSLPGEVALLRRMGDSPSMVRSSNTHTATDEFELSSSTDSRQQKKRKHR